MHARKCAGTSLEVMFCKSLGNFDIQIGSWTEILLSGNLPTIQSCIDSFRNPQFLPAITKASLSSFLSRDLEPFASIFNASIKHTYLKSLGPNTSCPTSAAVHAAFPAFWNDYFKFSIVRNPFHYEVSDYLWRSSLIPTSISFKDFLHHKLSTLTAPDPLIPYPATNWPIYTLNGNIALDFICRYETLSSDLHYLSKLLNIPELSAALPYTKVRSSSQHISDFYDSETIELVYRLHEPELTYFNYSLPF